MNAYIALALLLLPACTPTSKAPPASNFIAVEPILGLPMEDLPAAAALTGAIYYARSAWYGSWLSDNGADFEAAQYEHIASNWEKSRSVSVASDGREIYLEELLKKSTSPSLDRMRQTLDRSIHCQAIWLDGLTDERCAKPSLFVAELSSKFHTLVAELSFASAVRKPGNPLSDAGMLDHSIHAYIATLFRAIVAKNESSPDPSSQIEEELRKWRDATSTSNLWLQAKYATAIKLEGERATFDKEFLLKRLELATELTDLLNQQFRKNPFNFAISAIKNMEKTQNIDKNYADQVQVETRIFQFPYHD